MAIFLVGGDLNWNRIIPGTIRSIIRNESPIIRSDGTLIRDYIYVEDAVIAYMMLCEQLAKNAQLKGEAFNFSNESQHTVMALTDLILSFMNSSLKPIILNENRGEIKAQYLDSTKAQQILNWKATFSLEEGLGKTIDWYLSYFNEKT